MLSNKVIMDTTGYASLVTTIISAVWLATLGENIWIWIIYLVSSITGVVNNKLAKNGKMVAVFCIFCVTNIIALTRMLVGW